MCLCGCVYFVCDGVCCLLDVLFVVVVLVVVCFDVICLRVCFFEGGCVYCSFVVCLFCVC